MKSKLLLFALLLMGVSAGAQTPISVSISDDCSKNGVSKIVAITGSASVSSTSGRTSCDYVQLWEGGPKWATFNVGATITDYANLSIGADATPFYDNTDQAPYYNTANVGGLYAWNQPNYNGRQTTWTAGGITTDVADVATTLWGSNWETPTYEQLDTLQNSDYGKTTWTWCDGSTTQYVPGCTLKGYKVAGVGAYADKCIFLPAAGYFKYNYGMVSHASDEGDYSSTVDDTFGLYFYSSYRHMGYYDSEWWGLSVRAVLVETNSTTLDPISTQDRTLTLYADGCESPNTFICSEGQQLLVNATPMEHRHLVMWSDGNTDNPRLVTMNQDYTFTATFADDFTIQLTYENGYMSISGGKSYYKPNDTVTLNVTPNFGYSFVQWSDGVTDNPRTVVVTQDSAFTAEIVMDYEGKCGDNLTWKYNKGVLTVSGMGDMYNYSAYGSDLAPWTNFRDSITKVVLPDGLTSIGYSAFSDCSSLTSVTIPNSVTSIGYSAFSGCSGLTSITIPNSVTSIGSSAFSDCSSLISITIPNSVTSIGSSAFSDCSSLISITIPNSVTSIGSYAFHYCTGLTSITIPNSVTSIVYSAFYGCSGLTSVTIPSSVTSIESWAFADCSGLTSVTIPSSVTSIEREAFQGCSSLTSITIPNSVTSIESGAFADCSGLTSVTIPNSVTSIEEGTFYNCSSLTSITIPNSVTSIGTEAFSGCTKLRYITCYAPEPPEVEQNTFSNYIINLNVPCDYLDEYKFHAVWGSFRYIECIDAEESTVTTTTVTPSTTEATFAWPASATANTYTLTITKDGVVFCTLTFNANGQLLNIAFTPGRDGAAHAPEAELTATGYQFTVTGLESGSTYAYTLDAKDAGNNVVANYSGTFTTTGGEMGVESVNKYVNTPIKVVRDGQVLIQRGDRLYDLRGQEVR